MSHWRDSGLEWPRFCPRGLVLQQATQVCSRGPGRGWTGLGMPQMFSSLCLNPAYSPSQSIHMAKPAVSVCGGVGGEWGCYKVKGPRAKGVGTGRALNWRHCTPIYQRRGDPFGIYRGGLPFSSWCWGRLSGKVASGKGLRCLRRGCCRPEAGRALCGWDFLP